VDCSGTDGFQYRHYGNRVAHKANKHDSVSDFVRRVVSDHPDRLHQNQIEKKGSRKASLFRWENNV